MRPGAGEEAKAHREFNRAMDLDASVLDAAIEHFRNLAKARPKPADFVKMTLLLMKKGRMEDALQWAKEAESLSLKMTDREARATAISLVDSINVGLQIERSRATRLEMDTEAAELLRKQYEEKEVINRQRQEEEKRSIVGEERHRVEAERLIEMRAQVETQLQRSRSEEEWRSQREKNDVVISSRNQALIQEEHTRHTHSLGQSEKAWKVMRRHAQVIGKLKILAPGMKATAASAFLAAANLNADTTISDHDIHGESVGRSRRPVAAFEHERPRSRTMSEDSVNSFDNDAAIRRDDLSPRSYAEQMKLASELEAL
jgi:hypothetical protein